MVSLPIDFVSHPKIPVSLRSETSETGGSVSLFREKKFRYVSLQFCFEAKFGDTLVPRPNGSCACQSEMPLRGHLDRPAQLAVEEIVAFGGRGGGGHRFAVIG